MFHNVTRHVKPFCGTFGNILPRVGGCEPNGPVKTLKTQAIRTRIDPQTRNALEKLAAEENLDISDLVRRALRDFLAGRSITE